MNNSATSPGQWPELRHDSGLSGLQPLPGNIQKPEVAWKYPLGGILYDARAEVINGSHVILLLEGGCILCRSAVDGEILWKSQAEGYDALHGVEDLDNDGRTEIVASNGKSLFVLDAADGCVLWRQYLGPPMATGMNMGTVLVHRFVHVSAASMVCVALLSAREVVVYDFSTGARSPDRRHILWMDDFYHPSLLAADIDGDGQDELIVTKLSAVYVFDLGSGALKRECAWASGGSRKRNYGLFQAQDLNNDGQLDILILAHLVSRHIAVVGNNGGNLENVWDRFIEHIYPSDEKELRYTFNSCCDIDNDGHPEIIVSIFNESGDGHWRLHVLDAWTGQEHCAVPHLYLRGLHGGLVFASLESGRQPSETGTVVALQWLDGELREVWRAPDLGFVGRFIQADSRTALLRADTVLADEIWCAPVDGRLTVLLKDAAGGLYLLSQLYDIANSSLLPVPGVDGVVTILAIDDIDGDGHTELLLSNADGLVRSFGADGSVKMSFRPGMRIRYGTGLYYTPRPMPVPVAFAQDGHRYCAVPDGAGSVHLLKCGAGQPRMQWVKPGRGRVGPEETFHSVSVHPHNGAPCVLYSALGQGTATIIATDVAGNDQVRWQVPELPASPFPGRNRTGIGDYVVVQYKDRQLLVVSGYRSPSMNSERMSCIDMATGSAVWNGGVIGEGEEGRGFGPWNAMSVRAGDDGNPELLFLAKDILCRVDPGTGKFISPLRYLREPNTQSLLDRGITTDDFAAYGALGICDVDGDGRDELVTYLNYGGVGVLDTVGRPLWWRSGGLSSFACGFGCVADIDGDGVLEFAVGCADGDFLCLRAHDGLELWRLHLGGTISDVVACDIDGDGQIEFIASTQQGRLLCIAEWKNGCGYVKWDMDFGYSLGPPVAADCSGDGTSGILVVCGDGHLYYVHNQPDKT